MLHSESPLTLLERHVHEAEQNVAHQERAVAGLRCDGAEAEWARELLATLRRALAVAKHYLDVERGKLT